MVRHLTSVCYSALVSASQTQISLCHNLLLGCQIILRFVQSTIISRCGTLVLHINAEKPLRLDCQNLYCLFFPDFMFENLESKCHLTSFHDELIVAPSGWNLVGGNLPMLGKHANIARSWDLFPKYASSTHLKSKTTAYIHIYVWYKYPLKQNCHIFPRFDVKSTWFDSLLCHFALFHSTAYPPLVSCIPRWGMPKLRCPRNGSLDNDDTEKSLRSSTLHKWNQQIWHRSRTPIFLSFLSAVDRKSVRIYCALRRLFTVSVSLSAAWK